VRETTHLDGRVEREFFNGSELPEKLLEVAKDKTIREARFVKIGRNDSCPCGSGRKFKKCCIGRLGKGQFNVIGGGK
jgi:preprotein translocase subunit SecA